MKKIVKYIFMIVMILLLCGCRPVSFHNEKPDDAISSAIYEVIGDELYYLGKEELTNADLCYEYLIRYSGEKQREVLYDVVVAVNETIKKEEIRDKVCIIFSHELSGGATSSCVIIKNYSNNELKNPDCEGMQNLVICEFGYEDCVYDQPLTYITLPDIKYLEIDVEIQKRAEQAGIDWFECWPELEKIEVSASDISFNCKIPDDAISNSIYDAVGYEVFYLGKSENAGVELCYEYYIRDKWKGDVELAEILCGVATAVNDTIKEENITDFVSINFYWRNEYGTEEVVLSLYNYSDYQLEHPDLEGVNRAEILGGNYEEFKYNSPKTYSLLPNIKYLEVKEHIQEKADLQGIDWYDYWPDLKSIKLITSDTYPDGKIPDDAISSAIWNAVEDDLQYCGKSNEYRPRPELVYEYYIRVEGKDDNKIANVLYDAISAVNRTIKEENITDLVSIYFYIGKREYHNTELVLHLYNYSDHQLESPDLEGLQKAVIVGAEYKNSEYNNQETYSLLPNIKYLEVKDYVYGNAFDHGIDWYEYWPDLESIEVF